MAWYRVAYRPAVIVDLRKVEKALAQRLLDKTKWLASNVENLRHESIDPTLSGLFQYAVGDWRILYSIDREDQVLDVHLLGSASELYETKGTEKKS